MKRGRKSAYETKIKPRLEEIKAWCRDGYIEKQICEYLGISETTFNKYKKEYPKLLESLKINKEVADLTVENSLMKRANGYEYEEKRITETNGIRTMSVIKKTVLPDVTAQIFWLKNRKPEQWRDKQEIDHTSKGKEITGLKIEIIKPEGSEKKREK